MSVSVNLRWKVLGMTSSRVSMNIFQVRVEESSALPTLPFASGYLQVTQIRYINVLLLQSPTGATVSVLLFSLSLRDVNVHEVGVLWLLQASVELRRVPCRCSRSIRDRCPRDRGRQQQPFFCVCTQKTLLA